MFGLEAQGGRSPAVPHCIVFFVVAPIHPSSFGVMQIFGFHFAPKSEN